MKNKHQSDHDRRVHGKGLSPDGHVHFGTRPEISEKPDANEHEKNEHKGHHPSYGVRPSAEKEYKKEEKTIRIDLNSGKKEHFLEFPDKNSADIEKMLTTQYPKASLARINEHEFKLINHKRTEEIHVKSNSGKHHITVHNKLNEDIKNIMTEAFTKTYGRMYDAKRYYKDHTSGGREDDEFRDSTFKKNAISFSAPKPENNHYAIISSTHNLDNYPNVTKTASGHYALPITDDEHSQIHGLFPYNRNKNDDEIIADEAFRNRERPKAISKILQTRLPNVDAKLIDARTSVEPEVNDHYALLHVPEGRESDAEKLTGVEKSPKGRYYVKVPKRMYDSQLDTMSTNILLGNRTGWHDINHANNPNKNNWGTNSNMSHAIRVDKILSPDDIHRMKSSK